MEKKFQISASTMESETLGKGIYFIDANELSLTYTANVLLAAKKAALKLDCLTSICRNSAAWDGVAMLANGLTIPLFTKATSQDISPVRIIPSEALPLDLQGYKIDKLFIEIQYIHKDTRLTLSEAFYNYNREIEQSFDHSEHEDRHLILGYGIIAYTMFDLPNK